VSCTSGRDVVTVSREIAATTVTAAATQAASVRLASFTRMATTPQRTATSMGARKGIFRIIGGCFETAIFCDVNMSQPVMGKTPESAVGVMTVKGKRKQKIAIIKNTSE
jgi:hypothetical protein